MRFMDYGKKGWKLLCLLLVVINCQTFIACQTKPLDIVTALKPCQELLDKDELSAANQCYQRAMLAHPQNAVEISKHGEGVFFNKCVELEKREDYEKAIVCFEGMTILSPEKSNIYLHLASNYYKYSKTVKDKTDDLARAEEAIKKAIELRAESAIAHNTYGRILEETGNSQDAIKEHQQAIKLEPNDTLYLIDLAFAQEKFDDFTGALESYQRALTINPKDTDALYFLGLLYEKTGKTDKAIETIERWIVIEPAKQETLDRLKILKQRLEVEKSNQKPLKSKTKTQSN